MAQDPECFTAFATESTMCSGVCAVMLPQPMYVGLLPAAMKLLSGSTVSRLPKMPLFCGVSKARSTCVPSGG